MLNNAGDTKEYSSLWKIMLQMKAQHLKLTTKRKVGRVG